MPKICRLRTQIASRVLLPLLCCTASFCIAKEELIWLGADFPPAFIKKGPNANQGHIDKIEQYLKHRLSEYQHSSENANFSRILTSLKSRSDACSAALFKTPEREKYIEFSKPIYLILSNGIIFKRSSLAKFRPFIDQDKSISLSKVLQSKKTVLGISNNRSYGNQLNAIINQYRDTSAVYHRSGSNQLEGLLQMLQFNRIDYLIGYFNELQYVARQQGINPNELVFYPASELHTPYILGYIGCSKSKQGRQVIRSINQQLDSIRKQFVQYYAYWLDKPTQKLHRELTERYFKQ